MNAKKAVRLLVASAMVVIFLGLVACSTTPISKSDKEQQQDSVRDMAGKTLAQLYAKHPAARDAATKSAGYAVFSDFGFKVWTLGGARGKGVAVNNTTKQETFMEMLEFQPGMGFGASKFRVVFIFETAEAFNSFREFRLGVRGQRDGRRQDQGRGRGARRRRHGVERREDVPAQ